MVRRGRGENRRLKQPKPPLQQPQPLGPPLPLRPPPSAPTRRRDCRAAVGRRLQQRPQLAGGGTAGSKAGGPKKFILYQWSLDDIKRLFNVNKTAPAPAWPLVSRFLSPRRVVVKINFRIRCFVLGFFGFFFTCLALSLELQQPGAFSAVGGERVFAQGCGVSFTFCSLAFF